MREIKYFKDGEKKENLRFSFFFFLSYRDRIVINLCQKSDSDETMFKGFEVLPEALCYNTIFFWVVTQRAGSVAGCGLQRVQQTFYFRKKRLSVAGDKRGEGEGVGSGNQLSSDQSN